MLPVLHVIQGVTKRAGKAQWLPSGIYKTVPQYRHRDGSCGQTLSVAVEQAEVVMLAVLIMLDKTDSNHVLWCLCLHQIASFVMKGCNLRFTYSWYSKRE